MTASWKILDTSRFKASSSAFPRSSSIRRAVAVRMPEKENAIRDLSGRAVARGREEVVSNGGRGDKEA